MQRTDPGQLNYFISKLVESLSAPADIANQLADSLVGADLCGHHSHGTRLLPAKYVHELESGKINPTATSEIEHNGVFVIVNGNKGFGQIAARDGIDSGIEKSEEHGIGVVILRNVSHIGRVGEWAERVAESDKGSIALVSNPGSKWVAVPGSAQRRLSTNPIAFGMPTFDAFPFPFVLDMASSQVARGKIRQQDSSNECLPNELVIDQSGSFVTEDTDFERGAGAILPLGGLVTGHKGFGLAFMSEFLTGDISDGFVSGMENIAWGNQSIFYIIDVERFTERESIEHRASEFVEYIRDTDFTNDVSTPWTSTGERGLVPGELEHRAREENRTHGIPLYQSDLNMLRDLAKDQGISDLVPDPVIE